MPSKPSTLNIHPPHQKAKTSGITEIRETVQVNDALQGKKIVLLESDQEKGEEKDESEGSSGEGDGVDENKSNVDAKNGEDGNEDEEEGDGGNEEGEEGENMEIDDLEDNDDAMEGEHGRKYFGAQLSGNACGKLPKSTQEVIRRIMNETGWDTGTMAHEQSHEAMTRICTELRINMSNVDANAHTSRKPTLGKWLKAVKNFAYQVGSRERYRPKSKRKGSAVPAETDDPPQETISQRIRKRTRSQYNEDGEDNDDLADDEHDDHNLPKRRGTYYSTRSPSRITLPEMRVRASEAADRERVKHAAAYRFGALKTFQDCTLKMFMDLVVKPHETANEVFGEILKKQVGPPSQFPSEGRPASNGSHVHSASPVDIREYLIKPVQLMEFADRCANRLAGCKNSCGCHGKDDDELEE